MANGVCVYLSEGNSLTDATGEVMKETGLELEQSGFFVGAAAASYCPEHAPQLTAFVITRRSQAAVR